MKNFDNFLFRCSSLGNIITPSGKITDGMKTFLQEVFIGEIYGVKKEAYGKQLEKGIACEQDGLKMLNQALYPDRYVPKATEPKQNRYIKGTKDTLMDDIVYDIKNAYDRFTFGKAELTWLHMWQVKGYSMLEKKRKGRIFYCLNNMPDYMISEEENSMFYKQRKWATKENPDYLKACDELRAAHTYDSMPIHHKFKIFDVDYGVADAKRIISSVKQARTYLNGLLKEHNERLEKNLALMKPILIAELDKEVNAIIVS